MKFNRQLIDSLAFWINERERIRLKKERGEKPPWTKDPHLAAWRFCNVNRCDDRETRWIFKNIVEEHSGSAVVWFNLAVARFINWSPTLARLGYFREWSPVRFCRVIDEIQEEGGKVYTGAYMIRAGTGEDAALPKHEYLVKRVFNPLWEKRNRTPALFPRRGNAGDVTCAAWDEFFSTVFGMGDFMRNQIITDMKYSHHLPESLTTDWDSFILAGPGTQRGLNRLLSQHLKVVWKVEESADAIRGLRSYLYARKDLAWARTSGVFDDLNNLSNCLCEFDKYRRLIEGDGQPRSRYTPSSNPLP